jgi:hypothetical protein
MWSCIKSNSTVSESTIRYIGITQDFYALLHDSNLQPKNIDLSTYSKMQQMPDGEGGNTIKCRMSRIYTLITTAGLISEPCIILKPAKLRGI